jgi:hypothetical protein
MNPLRESKAAFFIHEGNLDDKSMLTIRSAQHDDNPAIHCVHTQAFDAMRTAGVLTLRDGICCPFDKESR